MWAKRVCIAGLAVYAVLSVTDFVQTYALIESTGGRVYEANPVAAGWLHDYGWSGLAVFKAGAVAVVFGVIAILARRRPKAGVGVVVAACLSLVYVTLYSHGLVTAKELDHPPTYDDPPAVTFKLVRGSAPGDVPPGPSTRRPPRTLRPL